METSKYQEIINMLSFCADMFSMVSKQKTAFGSDNEFYYIKPKGIILLSVKLPLLCDMLNGSLDSVVEDCEQSCPAVVEQSVKPLYRELTLCLVKLNAFKKKFERWEKSHKWTKEDVERHHCLKVGGRRNYACRRECEDTEKCLNAWITWIDGLLPDDVVRFKSEMQENNDQVVVATPNQEKIKSFLNPDFALIGTLCDRISNVRFSLNQWGGVAHYLYFDSPYRNPNLVKKGFQPFVREFYDSLGFTPPKYIRKRQFVGVDRSSINDVIKYL